VARRNRAQGSPGLGHGKPRPYGWTAAAPEAGVARILDAYRDVPRRPWFGPAAHRGPAGLAAVPALLSLQHQRRSHNAPGGLSASAVVRYVSTEHR
jgi:hypothetical protein